MALIRKTRASTPTTTNDNYKGTNGTTIRRTKLSYNLDEARAIVKKLQTCDRPTEITEKPGNNYVIELSTAGFEAFRKIMMMNVHLNDTARPSRHYEYEVKTDQKDNIVQDTLRINSWQALHGNLSLRRTGSLSAVINMYRTTCRVLINGRDSAAIASSINTMLKEINSNPEVKAGNEHLKITLDPAKLKSKQAAKKQQKPSPADYAPTSPPGVLNHNAVTPNSIIDRRKSTPQSTVRASQNTPKPTSKLHLKVDQIKEYGGKSKDPNLKNTKVPKKVEKSIEQDQIEERRIKNTNSDLKKEVTQKEKKTENAQYQRKGVRNDNPENPTDELASIDTDSTLHGDADENTCPVCSENVGMEGLICNICNECLHAACEKVEMDNDLAEYVCRTCQTVEEIDCLHTTEGREPASQSNGNNVTPDALRLPTKLPIATHRQNQSKSPGIVSRQPNQALTFPIRNPAPTALVQQNASVHTAEEKSKQNTPLSRSPSYNHVSTRSYDQLFSDHNQLKEELDSLKSQQNSDRRKNQAKEKQIKKREAELIQKEAQQRELYEQNRLLKDYGHTLELKVNDLEEQNKQLKLNLLTSESLRTNTTRDRQQQPTNEAAQKEDVQQKATTDVNETIMVLLTTSMATISSNMVALQNQINQVNQKQTPHTKIVNVYSRESYPKRIQRNESTNHYGQIRKKSPSLNNESYEPRKPTNKENPRQDDDKQRIARSSNEDWRREEQKSYKPQQKEAEYNKNWRQEKRSDDELWRQKQRVHDEGDWKQTERRSRHTAPSQNQRTRSDTDSWRREKKENDQRSGENKEQTNEPFYELGNEKKENDPRRNDKNEQANESIYELASEDFLGSSRKPKTPDKTPRTSPSPSTN
jgi:hypothetical protein